MKCSTAVCVAFLVAGTIWPAQGQEACCDNMQELDGCDGCTLNLASCASGAVSLLPTCSSDPNNLRGAQAALSIAELSITQVPKDAFATWAPYLSDLEISGWNTTSEVDIDTDAFRNLPALRTLVLGKTRWARGPELRGGKVNENMFGTGLAVQNLQLNVGNARSIPGGLLRNLQDTLRAVTLAGERVVSLGNGLFTGTQNPLFVTFDAVGGLVFNADVYDAAFKSGNLRGVDIDTDGVAMCCGFADALLAEFPDSAKLNRLPSDCLPDDDVQCKRKSRSGGRSSLSSMDRALSGSSTGTLA